MEDTWVKIKTKEVEAYREHNITFEDMKKLPFLCCPPQGGWGPNTGVKSPLTQTSTHHPLVYNPRVIRTLNHGAANVPAEGKKSNMTSSYKNLQLSQMGLLNLREQRKRTMGVTILSFHMWQECLRNLDFSPAKASQSTSEQTIETDTGSSLGQNTSTN